MKEKHHKRLANYTANKSSEPQLPVKRDLTRLEAFVSPWRPRDVFVLSQEQARRTK